MSPLVVRWGQNRTTRCTVNVINVLKVSLVTFSCNQHNSNAYLYTHVNSYLYFYIRSPCLLIFYRRA